MNLFFTALERIKACVESKKITPTTGTRLTKSVMADMHSYKCEDIHRNNHPYIVKGVNDASAT